MGIYTKTGDKGTTARLSGERVPKTDNVIEANGALDELNAALGRACCVCDLIDLPGDGWNTSLDFFPAIQADLLLAGAALSSGDPPRWPLPQGRVQAFEDLVDSVEKMTGELSAFLVPGVDIIDAELHVCRAVCRRAERRIVALGEDAPQDLLPYINRLADTLFSISVLHRYRYKFPPFDSPVV